MNGNGVGESGDVLGEIGVVVEFAICISAIAVRTVEVALCITSVGLVVGIDMKLLQDAWITVARNNGINVFSKIFTIRLPLMLCMETPNGLCNHRGELAHLRTIIAPILASRVRTRGAAASSAAGYGGRIH